MEFLESNEILNSYQHVFRKKIYEIQLVITVQDNCYQIDVILLDSKAFHKVSHQQLAAKLYHYASRDQALSWTKSFLANRSQCEIFIQEKFRCSSGDSARSSPVLDILHQSAFKSPRQYNSRGGSRSISEGAGDRFNHITVFTLRIRTGLSKQCKPRSDAAERGAWSESTLFGTHPVILHIFTGSKQDLLKRRIWKSVPNLSNLSKISHEKEPPLNPPLDSSPTTACCTE